MTYIVKLLLSIGLAIAGAGVANLAFYSPSTTSPTSVEAVEIDEETQTFIDTHSPSAKAVGQVYDVPPSVLLACALQTYTFDDTGKFEENNAWFLLEAEANWEGETFELANAKLKSYPTARESFEDFAIWLSLQPDTYTRKKTWWQILKSKGYDAEYLADQFNLTSIDR